MSDIAWIAAALVGGTILLEVWFANQRLNEQMASVLLLIDWNRKEEEDDLVAEQRAYWAQFSGPITEDMIDNQPKREEPHHD